MYLSSKSYNKCNIISFMPEPINITFLGTGAAVPTVKRSHPAILLHYGTEYLLFDCGEGTQVQMEKAGVSPMKITKIFISHWHADHFVGLIPLIETLHLSGREAPLEIYGPDASRFIDIISELSYWSFGFDILTHDCIPNKKIYEDKLFEVSTIKVKHSVPSVGYCFKEKDHWHIDTKKAKKYGLGGKQLQEIKTKGKLGKVKLKDIAKVTPGRKIIYSGDTLISPALFKVAKNADLLIHDGTFVENVEERSHPSAKEVAKLAKKAGVKKLILTHISKRYKTSKEIENVVKPIFKNTIVAKDLMKVKI